MNCNRSHRGDAHDTFLRITNAVGTITILFACSLATLGQSPKQNIVVIRNVLLASDASDSSKAVIVAGGQIDPLAEGEAVPAGALVIDGGGSVLSVGVDGTINLRPVSQTARTTTASWKGPDIPPSSAVVTSQTAAQNPDRDLAAKVVDPTSPLKTVTFQNKYSPSLWGLQDRQNDLDTVLAIPLQFLGRPNILKVTIPYDTTLPSGNRGLGDVSIFDIAIIAKKWGTLAIGPVASFGVNKGPGVDTFSIGPAIGAVFKKEKWVYGVFNQNLFSPDSVATSQLQPILAYTVNQKISVAFGDQQFTYDWKKNRFTFAPAGFQFNYIAKFGKQPVRFIFGPQYNIKNEFGSRKWTITTGFALILR